MNWAISNDPNTNEMSLEYFRLAFHSQADKTELLTYSLVNSVALYTSLLVEEYCQKVIKSQNLDDDFFAFFFNGEVYYRSEEALLTRQKMKALRPPINEESMNIFNMVDKLQEDIRFFQQWLSIVLCNSKAISDISLGTFNKFPPVIKDLVFKIFDVPPEYLRLYKYEVPKGKENLWIKAEKLIKYYLGFKLVV